MPRLRIIQELFPVLQDIIAWHQRGIRFNIHVDETAVIDQELTMA